MLDCMTVLLLFKKGGWVHLQLENGGHERARRFIAHRLESSEVLLDGVMETA